MNIRELINALSELDPDLEIWEPSPYSAGVRKATYRPRVDRVITKPRTNPRFESQLQYERDPGKWTLGDQVARVR